MAPQPSLPPSQVGECELVVCRERERGCVISAIHCHLIHWGWGAACEVCGKLTATSLPSGKQSHSIAYPQRGWGSLQFRKGSQKPFSATGGPRFAACCRLHLPALSQLFAALPGACGLAFPSFPVSSPATPAWLLEILVRVGDILNSPCQSDMACGSRLKPG